MKKEKTTTRNHEEGLIEAVRQRQEEVERRLSFLREYMVFLPKRENRS